MKRKWKRVTAIVKVNGNILECSINFYEGEYIHDVVEKFLKNSGISYIKLSIISFSVH